MHSTYTLKYGNMKIILPSLFILLSIRMTVSVDPLSVHNATRVLEKFLDGYRDEIGPIVDGQPVIVKMNMYINDMVPIKKADWHFSVDCYLRMQWVDPRLKFNASSADEFIPFGSEFVKEIWTPNIYFPTGKSGFLHPLTKPNIFIKVHSDGRVYFSERLSLVSFCMMNMSFYPFDIQYCHLSMEDYSNPVEYVKLLWMDPPTEQPPGELTSLDFAKIRLSVSNKTRVGDFNHKFDKLIIHIDLFRDLQLYVLRDFLPCILIVMMSWVTFWINHKQVPARVCLGITTVLTTVSMTSNVQKVNPTSNTLRSIDVFLLICLVFVFGALLELAFTGMADMHGSKWWKETMKENEGEGDENTENAKEEREETGPSTSVEDGVKVTKTSTFLSEAKKRIPLQLINIRPARRTGTGPMGESSRNPGMKNSLKSNTKFLGPFVFLHGEPHIVDQYAKVFFPLTYFSFIAVFFLFHHLHPDTVGGSNA